MRFTDGQQVLIKNPRELTGIVVKVRPGDFELPDDQKRYIVRINEVDRFYRDEDLELAEPAGDGRLERYSPEWNAELQKFLSAGKRLSEDNSDRTALDELSTAGTKLGFIVPIKKS